MMHRFGAYRLQLLESDSGYKDVVNIIFLKAVTL